LCILAGVLFANQVNASENNSKDDVKYAALTQKDFDALPVEKRASVLDELGFIHEYGLNVPMNREQALQYYKQACELGGNYGCYNVKYAYQHGDGVAKDSAQANKYAKKMNLDNLLIEQEYIDKFSQEIYVAKALADMDKSQRAAFISILIHALNNRPESDALFLVVSDLIRKKRSALLRYGGRTAIHKWIINWGYSPLMISLAIMWMSLIKPGRPR
ncbi:sel1 repeat family protein, partial [Salmonella enterica subsp. enterica serovar Typhi]|nr:sel1 repeat family protein [Salmonella enterica subsp. enterica serovar Typhi]